MSKTLLSRIKPVHGRKPTSLSPFRLTPRLKELVNETIEILKTHPQYDQLLENRFADEETQVSELLARFRVFSEIELVLNSMRLEGIKPTHEALSFVVRAYACSGLVDKASELYDYVIELHNCGPDVFTWEADVAMTVRDKMMQRGVLPDAGIYNVLMSGLCKKGRLPAAKILLGEMLDHNILPDAFVYATLIDGFIRNGDLDEAKKLFELTIAKGMDPGVVGYNAMIKGYCKFGLMNDALSCLNKMTQKHHAPDEFTFSTIIDGYVKQHDLSSALRMFGKMVKQKCKPNVVTYTALINGFCRIGDSDRAERTFKAMQSCGLVPNVVTYTIIIGSFCKQGRVAKATSFFELMLMNKCIPNDVTFNYLVNGFTNNAPNVVSTNESEDDNKPIFLEFFGRMISDGWGHKAATYNAILICLCRHGMVKTALQLHDKMVIKGFLQDPVSFAALLLGVCLEGRSKEWKNIIPCNLNEQELQIAVKYLQSLKQYLLRGMTSEVALCFHNLVEDLKSWDQKLDNYKTTCSIPEQDMGLLMEERSGSLLGFRCFTSSVVILSESNDGYKCPSSTSYVFEVA
ncbi:hypothetical protein Patl1_34482 [Pistacia atlantica]|uniref:Uncharacterized protein n=1 Tax=Pistacia atlantica TaxID=434234 RepID=A0ACC0ZPU8_9ROSI|nr:hypothetical protein Patl1_34482 [Pistacia atlantica]